MGIQTSVRALSLDLAKAAAVATPVLQLAVEKAAYDIEARAKLAAPVDTGALRGSISTEIGQLEAVVGPTVDYAAFVEYGTSRMGPQPYMETAVDEVESNFYAAIDAIIGKFL